MTYTDYNVTIELSIISSLFDNYVITGKCITTVSKMIRYIKTNSIREL